MTLRVLSLGWGVQSWTLAAMAALGDLEPLDYVIHADTSHEMEGTYRHAEKWTPWLGERGVKVKTVRADNTEPFRADWGKGAVQIPAFSLDWLNGGHGQVRRQCTHDWKITPIRRFLRSVVEATLGAVRLIQGISFDEWQRMRTSDVKYILHEYPLVDRRMTRGDCILWLQNHGLDVPPKSACTFCPFHSIEGWKRLKQAAGADWQEALAVDEAIRNKRPKHTLYVHPAREPLAEAVKVPGDFGAEQMEFEMPCDGGHCWV